jgi:amino acid transporter
MSNARKATLLQLVFLIYGVCAAGPYGLEEMVSESGPGMTLLLLLVMPLLWGIPIALATAELATMLPVEGGYYRWSKLAFGDFWAFQCGWWAWSANIVNGALYAVLFTDYAQAWDPDLRVLAPLVEPLHRALSAVPILGTHLFPSPRDLGDWVVCLALTWFLTWLNLRGIRVVGDSSILMNVALLIPFAIITVAGLAGWRHNPVAPFVAPHHTIPSAFVAGILISIWLYSGYEMLSTAAEEIDDPRRNFPRALTIAVPMVALSYAVPTFAALAALGSWEAWAPQYFTEVGRILGGKWGDVLGGWVIVGGLLSNAVLMNVNMLSISRLPLVMAQDRYLPAFLARVSPATGAPIASLLVGGAIYSLLTLRGFGELIKIFAFLQGANYIMIYLSLLRLRRRMPGAPRPFRIGGGNLGLTLVVAPPFAVAALALTGKPEDVLWGLGAIAVGPVAYLLARFMRSRSGQGPTAAATPPSGARGPEPDGAGGAPGSPADPP